MGLVAFCLFVLFLTLFNTFGCWGQAVREKQNICREAQRPILSSELGFPKMFPQNTPQAYWRREVKGTSCIHRVWHAGSIPPTCRLLVTPPSGTFPSLQLARAGGGGRVMVLGRWGGNASATEDRDEPIPSPEPLQLHLPKYGVEFRKKIIYI